MTGRGGSKYFNACSTGRADVVASLLEAGVDPDARDQNGLTGLIWAGRKGRIDVADLLIARGALIEGADRRGRTALFHAVTYQRYDFVEHLAKLRANVSAIDVHGSTPPDFSESTHDKKMVSLLKRFGAASAQRGA